MKAYKCFAKKSKNKQLGSAFSEYLEAQILNISMLGANHGGAFMSSMGVPVSTKKLWIHHCLVHSYVQFIHSDKTALGCDVDLFYISLEIHGSKKLIQSFQMV